MHGAASVTLGSNGEFAAYGTNDRYEGEFLSVSFRPLPQTTPLLPGRLVGGTWLSESVRLTPDGASAAYALK